MPRIAASGRWSSGTALLVGALTWMASTACDHETAPLPTFLELAGTQVSNPPRPVDDGLFAMPTSAQPAGVVFEGRLALQGELFPGRELVFIQDGRDLIPVRRGLVEDAFSAWGTNWNYILEPGHIWQGGEGYAVASLPITLVPRLTNCTYNGVLAFVFDGQAVSDVWAQLTAETCAGYPIDAALWLTATYRPGGIADAAAVRAAYGEESRYRFPAKPLSDLAADYPGVDLTAFGRNVREPSAYGFVINGVNYVSDCPTRHGRYAYCDMMRFPSFSTAKSAFAGMAFLRLGQKYGPEVGGLLLKDYLPELRDGATDYPGWATVTIEHVLDMASGHYGTESTFTDSASERLGDGSSATTVARATLALPALAPPGTRFFYRSGETFLAVRAMQEYLRTKQGPQADLFDFVVGEVYRPLHIGPGFFTTMRTPDTERQALGATGLWWTVDDAAKIATFLQGGGRVAGEQLLPPALLADSMFQNPADRGLPQMDSPLTRYNNAFWGNLWGPESPRPGFTCNFWTAGMTGYGGIEILMLPNDAVYYYFSDGSAWYSDAAVLQADRLAPICR
jgi:hypothetical protein